MNLNKIRIWECREGFTLLLPVLDAAWNFLCSQRHRHFMFTCPDNRPLVNPIPYKTGQCGNPIPFLGVLFPWYALHGAMHSWQEHTAQVQGGFRTGESQKPESYSTHPNIWDTPTSALSSGEKNARERKEERHLFTFFPAVKVNNGTGTQEKGMGVPLVRTRHEKKNLKRTKTLQDKVGTEKQRPCL